MATTYVNLNIITYNLSRLLTCYLMQIKQISSSSKLLMETPTVCFPSYFPQVYVIHTTWSDRCRFEIYRRYTEFRTFEVSHCITQLYNTFTVTHFDTPHFREPSIGYFHWRLGNTSPVVESYQLFKVSLACLGFMCLVHLHRNSVLIR